MAIEGAIYIHGQAQGLRDICREHEGEEACCVLEFVLRGQGLQVYGDAEFPLPTLLVAVAWLTGRGCCAGHGSIKAAGVEVVGAEAIARGITVAVGKDINQSPSLFCRLISMTNSCVSASEI